MTRDKKSAVGNERWSSYAMDESGGALSDLDDSYSRDSGTNGRTGVWTIMNLRVTKRLKRR